MPENGVAAGAQTTAHAAGGNGAVYDAAAVEENGTPSNGVALVASDERADAPESEPDVDLPAVVLVRGCPRSGTTMVAEILNASPNAAVMFEYALGALAHDLEPIFAYGLGHRDLRAKLTRAHTQKDPSTYYNQPKAAPVIRFPVKERFGEILAAVVAASLRKSNVSLIGSKTPGHQALGDRAALKPHFERIMNVLVVRNPLRTVNSMLNRRNLSRAGVDVWPIADVDEAIAEYRQSVNILLSHLDRYPDDTYVVKYEDLLTDFEDTVQRMCSFLGISIVIADERAARVAMIRRQPGATRDVLDPDELDAVVDEFGPAIDAWDGLELTGTGAAIGDRLIDCVDHLEIGKRYKYGTSETGRSFLGLGWSVLESEGVWTDDRRADLFFSTDYEGDVVAYLNASFFLPPGVETLSVRIDGNGKEIFRGTCVRSDVELFDATSGPVRIFAGPGPCALLCGPIRLEGSGIQRITMHIDNAQSPREAGVSGDERVLGMLLHSLVLAPA